MAASSTMELLSVLQFSIPTASFRLPSSPLLTHKLFWDSASSTAPSISNHISAPAIQARSQIYILRRHRRFLFRLHPIRMPPILLIQPRISLRLRLQLPHRLLDQVLPVEGGGRDLSAKNEIRKSIRALFLDRDCFTIVRPLSDENELQRLDQISIEKLRPEFKAGLDELTRFVFERTRPKQLGATVMTGPIFVGISQSFLDALNNGAVPAITSSWQSVEETECQKALEYASEVYKSSFDRTRPPDEAVIREAHEEAVQMAVAAFNSTAVGAGSARQRCEKRLHVFFKKEFENKGQEVFMVNLRNDLSKSFTNEIQAMVCKLKALYQKNPKLALLPKAVSFCANSQAIAPKNQGVHVKVQMGSRIPKVEMGAWKTVKREQATVTNNYSKGHKHNREREWSVAIESDEDSDGGFTILSKEKETGSFLMEKAKEETERILRKARR